MPYNSKERQERYTLNFDLNVMNLYPRIGRPKHIRTRKYSGCSDSIILPGIYFLFHKEEIVYVGESSHILKRLKEHCRSSMFWNYYSYIKEDNPAKRLAIEALCIDRFQPKYNTRGR